MRPDDPFEDHVADADDRDLLARLRAVDPAASLPPAGPAEVARLAEDAMNQPLDTPDVTEPTPLEPRRSRPQLWIAVAAAAAVAVFVGFLALRPTDRGDDPVAAPGPTVSHLDVAPVAGRCAPVTAEVLQQQEVAFDGVVTKLGDGMATLEVSHWYRGAPTDVVEIRAPGLDQRQLLDVVAFQVGDRYLVAGHDGSVAPCGASGAYSDQLAGLYAQAFGG
jgi:hypothetical protein